MIKVMVLFYGLVIFVPQDEIVGGKRAKELTVLFVDDEKHQHTPVVYTVGTDGKLMKLLDLPNKFNIVISRLNGTVGLEARKKSADLQDLYDSGSPTRIRADCMKDTRTCKRGGADLVRGWARVQGGWDTQPATYCNGRWSNPVKFDEGAMFQFRTSEVSPKHDDFDERPIATALRLDTEIACDNVEDCEPLEKLMRLGNQPVDLEPIVGKKCADWIGRGAERCVILVIGNDPPPGRPDGIQLLDKHFDAFYSLTVNPPVKRWLPYIFDNPCCPEGFEPRLAEPTERDFLNRPAPLCPPTWATAQN